jgi:hypothetical protein
MYGVYTPLEFCMPEIQREGDSQICIFSNWYIFFMKWALINKYFLIHSFYSVVFHRTALWHWTKTWELTEEKFIRGRLRKIAVSAKSINRPLFRRLKGLHWLLWGISILCRDSSAEGGWGGCRIYATPPLHFSTKARSCDRVRVCKITNTVYNSTERNHSKKVAKLWITTVAYLSIWCNSS